MTGKQVHIFVQDLGDVAGRDAWRIHRLMVALAVCIWQGYGPLVRDVRQQARELAEAETARGNPKTTEEILSKFMDDELQDQEHAAMIYAAALALELGHLPDRAAVAEAVALIDDALGLGPREV